MLGGSGVVRGTKDESGQEGHTWAISTQGQERGELGLPAVTKTAMVLEPRPELKHPEKMGNLNIFASFALQPSP